MQKHNIDTWLFELEYTREILSGDVNNVKKINQLIAASMAVGIGFLELMRNTLILYSTPIYLFGATIISLIFNFFVVLAWSTIFEMSVHAARVMAIEDKVNNIIGENIFTWESKINLRINTTKIRESVKILGVINPSIFIALISGMLYISFQTIVILFMINVDNSSELNIIWSIAVGTLNASFLFVILLQWLKTMSVSFRNTIKKEIENSFKKHYQKVSDNIE